MFELILKPRSCTFVRLVGDNLNSAVIEALAKKKTDAKLQNESSASMAKLIRDTKGHPPDTAVVATSLDTTETQRLCSVAPGVIAI